MGQHNFGLTSESITQFVLHIVQPKLLNYIYVDLPYLNVPQTKKNLLCPLCECVTPVHSVRSLIHFMCAKQKQRMFLHQAATLQCIFAVYQEEKPTVIQIFSSLLH